MPSGVGSAEPGGPPPGLAARALGPGGSVASVPTVFHIVRTIASVNPLILYLQFGML